MLLRKAEVAQVVKNYLRGGGLSQDEEAAISKAVIGDAEIAIMEIVRHRVKMAVSQ